MPSPPRSAKLAWWTCYNRGKYSSLGHGSPSLACSATQVSLKHLLHQVVHTEDKYNCYHSDYQRDTEKPVEVTSLDIRLP